MATNVFTQVREAIEALFADLDSVVDQVLTFNSEYAILRDDPAFELRKIVRIDPMGGPVDDKYTAGAAKLTRRFLVVFNLPVGNMDADQIEAIDAAILGCLFAGEKINLGLSFVQSVRVQGGEYDIYEKAIPGQSTKQEMFVGFGTVEVDLKINKDTIESWAPESN